MPRWSPALGQLGSTPDQIGASTMNPYMLLATLIGIIVWLALITIYLS